MCVCVQVQICLPQIILKVDEKNHLPFGLSIQVFLDYLLSI